MSAAELSTARENIQRYKQYSLPLDTAGYQVKDQWMCLIRGHKPVPMLDESTCEP